MGSVVSFLRLGIFITSLNLDSAVLEIEMEMEMEMKRPHTCRSLLRDRCSFLCDFSPL